MKDRADDGVEVGTIRFFKWFPEGVQVPIDGAMTPMEVWNAFRQNGSG